MYGAGEKVQPHDMSGKLCGISVKLIGSALVVSDIDSADLAIAQQAYTAWIDENVSEFDLA